MEECIPYLEVFEYQLWDVNLAFEASGGLEITEAAEKMSGCGEDISDVVEATDDGFELGSGGLSSSNNIGNGVNPGKCFGVGEANN